MSGRVAAVDAVDENGKITVFVGAASGGVWKSINGATTFKPVFDKQKVQSIGAVTIDPTDHKTVWVGTGESWTRNSVSVGDGIYKSTDGGENWTNVGLKNSERISRILVDPTDGNNVLACATGHLWDDNDERGVYKTTDGGKTWNKVLDGANLSTGCGMLSMSPQIPRPSLLPPGISGVRAGHSVPAARAADYLNQPMAATTGQKSPLTTHKACRRSHRAASPWPWRLPSPTWCTR